MHRRQKIKTIIMINIILYITQFSLKILFVFMQFPKSIKEQKTTTKNEHTTNKKTKKSMKVGMLVHQYMT